MGKKYCAFAGTGIIKCQLFPYHCTVFQNRNSNTTYANHSQHLQRYVLVTPGPDHTVVVYPLFIRLALSALRVQRRFIAICSVRRLFDEPWTCAERYGK